MRKEGNPGTYIRDALEGIWHMFQECARGFHETAYVIWLDVSIRACCVNSCCCCCSCDESKTSDVQFVWRHDRA